MAFSASIYNTLQKIIISGQAFWNWAFIETIQRGEQITFIKGLGAQAYGENLVEVRPRLEIVTFSQQIGMAVGEIRARSEKLTFSNP